MLRTSFLRRCITASLGNSGNGGLPSPVASAVTPAMVSAAAAVVPPSGPPVMVVEWGFNTKSKGFVPMVSTDSAAVEAAYTQLCNATNQSSPVRVTLSNGHSYDYTFGPRRLMVQTNTSTNTRRKLKRAVVPHSTTTIPPSARRGSGRRVRRQPGAAVITTAATSQALALDGAALQRELSKVKSSNPTLLKAFPHCALYAATKAVGAGGWSIAGLKELAEAESAADPGISGRPTARIEEAERVVVLRVRKWLGRHGALGRDLALLDVIARAMRFSVRRINVAPPRTTALSHDAARLRTALGTRTGFTAATRGLPYCQLNATLGALQWKIAGCDDLASKEETSSRGVRRAKVLVDLRVRRWVSRHGAVGKDVALLHQLDVAYRHSVRKSRK